MCGRRSMTCRRRARLRLGSDAFTSAAVLSWYFCLAIIIINIGDLRKANGANKVLPLSLALSPSAGAGGPYSSIYISPSYAHALRGGDISNGMYICTYRMCYGRRSTLDPLCAAIV